MSRPAHNGQLGIAWIASKIDCQQGTAPCRRVGIGEVEGDVPGGVGPRLPAGGRLPVEVGILNEPPAEVNQPLGLRDVEPAAGLQPAGVTVAGRRLEQPEFDQRGPGNSLGRLNPVEGEAPPRLLPLKPDSDSGRGEPKAEKADNQQGSRFQAGHGTHLGKELPRSRSARRTTHCILQEKNVLSGLPGQQRAIVYGARIVPMPNQFDPYREALVVEQHTIWPDDYEDWSEADRGRVETLLHAAPAEAAELDYVRQHTGFARVITVTPDDVERVAAT